MHIIQNDQISLGAKEKGAEFCSLKAKSSQIEYIWQADPNHWGRSSCILFPVIGKMNKGLIRIEGTEYSMPKHGIVRDRDFELISKSEEQMVFEFCSDKESFQSFPFPFVLHVQYCIEASLATIKYTVRNVGDKWMPFNIGAHPAFNCPVEQSARRSDYFLRFQHEEMQESPVIGEDGLLGIEKRQVLSGERDLWITDELFDKDALILSKLKSTGLCMMNSSGKAYFEFEFGGFDQLGIWSSGRNSPFVCLEPWLGTADYNGFDADFTRKGSIQRLSPGEEFSCVHRIKII